MLPEGDVDLLAALAHVRGGLQALTEDDGRRAQLFAGLLRELGELEQALAHSDQDQAAAPVDLAGALAALDARIGGCEHEREVLNARFELTEHTISALYDRLNVVEDRREQLINLWVAGSQLREAEDRERVRAAILEVVINLIGCEQVGLFERVGDRFELRAAMGLDERRGAGFELGVGPGWLPARLLQAQPLFIVDEGEPGPDADDRDHGLSSCLPLFVAGRLEGVVLTYALLGHKPDGFTELDRALLRLLAAHAGPALLSPHAGA